MLSRREFLYSSGALGALSAATLSGFELQGAPRYELLVKGGRVLDASQRIDRVMDVAIQNGKIAALRPGIADADAAQVIDARGKIVTPGLIDLHVHAADFRPNARQLAPGFALSTGVTSLTDAGSAGTDAIERLIPIARSAPNRVRILINLGRQGISGSELMDLANVDPVAIRRAIDAHPDVIVGIKARLSRNVAGEHDLEAVRLAHQVTVPLRIPLMVHVGQTFSPLGQIVAQLQPGDIVTHVYSPPPNGIFDDNGRIFPQILEARRRGVFFDIGNGRNGHITWDVAERAIQQGFLPDTISSDLTDDGRTNRVFDLPTVMSKFLMLGMTVEQVIACVTATAARAMPAFKDLGTLKVGAPADLAVLELQEGTFEFVDNVDAKRSGRQKLFTRAVVAAGKRVAQAAG